MLVYLINPTNQGAERLALPYGMVRARRIVGRDDTRGPARPAEVRARGSVRCRELGTGKLGNDVLYRMQSAGAGCISHGRARPPPCTTSTQ